MPHSPPRAEAHPGVVLRKLRLALDRSQMDLAFALDISQRHLSFIETARAQPSRELILAWADECRAAESDRNAALRLGGFAPASQPPDLDAPQYRAVYDSLVTMLEAHEPFPAFVFNADWLMLRLNRGGQRNCMRVMPAYFSRQPQPDRGMDMIDALADPEGLLRCMRDPLVAGSALLAQLRAEQFTRPSLKPRIDRCERALRQRYGPLLEPPRDPAQTAFAAVFDTDAGPLSTIAVQTVFALPQNVTCDSLRIEMWFPTDERSRRTMTGPGPWVGVPVREAYGS